MWFIHSGRMLKRGFWGGEYQRILAFYKSFILLKNSNMIKMYNNNFHRQHCYKMLFCYIKNNSNRVTHNITIWKHMLLIINYLYYLSINKCVYTKVKQYKIEFNQNFRYMLNEKYSKGVKKKLLCYNLHKYLFFYYLHVDQQFNMVPK